VIAVSLASPELLASLDHPVGIRCHMAWKKSGASLGPLRSVPVGGNPESERQIRWRHKGGPYARGDP
jgi:hypothetical protein